jgi:hypothetical protein
MLRRVMSGEVHPPGRLARAFDRFCGDAPLIASRKLRITLEIVAIVVAVSALLFVTRLMWTARPPPPLEMGHDGDAVRWGLSLDTRQTMFREIAAADPGWRKEAAGRFPQAWRREDDRAAMERDYVRSMAGRYHVNLTVAYLVVDEGIRLKWTVPNGAPLSASVVPLQMK